MRNPTRRDLACGIAAGWTASTLPALAQAPAIQAAPAAKTEGAGPWRDLAAAPAQIKLRPDEGAKEAAFWVFDGQLAGPVIRVRQGEEVRLRLANKTPSPVTLHWHGVRNLSAMDGVGGLTQPAVEPGGSFEYRFTPPDAGTFLVRPLCPGRSGEAAGRGLSALLVVDEPQPPKVDADLACLVQDWRLEPDGTLAPFGGALEAAFLGRLGGVITVNGRAIPERVELAPGSRVRLRLANGCNARVMRIRFDGVKVYVATIDGQPTDTFEPLRASLPFPPGTRYDLMLDIAAQPGPSGAVVALVGQGAPLIEFAARGDAAESKRPALPAIAAPAPNKLLPAQIKLQNAARREIVIGGGAGRGPSGDPVYAGDPARIWTMNGKPGTAGGPPVLSVKRGSPVVFNIKNQTPLPQPVHLHGHVFRLLHPADDGWEPYWLDTLQIAENRNVHIAFVADNPGRWAISSTVLERFDTGLWTWFEVT